MDTSLKLSEVAIDAALAKLKNGVPARLSTINAEKNDGLTVAPPADGSYYPFGWDGLGVIPAVFVTELPSPEYEAESAGAFVWVGELAVVVVDEDTSRAMLGRRLLRLARAATEALLFDPPMSSLEGSAFYLRPVRHVPGPVFEPERDESMWRAMYMVIFRARQYEGP